MRVNANVVLRSWTLLATFGCSYAPDIITRRMLSIVGERELRLHSDSQVNIFLSCRGCFKYYFVCFVFSGWVFIYLCFFLFPFCFSPILVCYKRELSCTALHSE